MRRVTGHARGITQQRGLSCRRSADPVGERPQRMALPVLEPALDHIRVHRRLVGVRDCGNVIRAFRPALDFQARRSRVDEVIKMAEHVHILRIEQERSLAVLLDREEPAGTLLLDHMVFPAAGLRAIAMIAAAAGQIIRQQAAPGEGHAHRAVHEAFDIKIIRRIRADVTDRVQVKLAGEHHTLRAQFVQRVRGTVVGDACLRGHMQFEIRGDMAGFHHDADIGDDQRVDPDFGELAQILAHGRDLVVMRQNVAGHVHAGAMLVRVSRALLEILEREILRRRTHAEGLAAAVDGVRAEIDCGFQAAQVAGRRQHFGAPASMA